MSLIPPPPPTEKKASPMGGWLVIFIAMYVISAAQSLLGLWPAFQIAAQMPHHAMVFLSAAAVIGAWNVFILYSVIMLILLKPHAVRVTKLMLLTGPFIAALTPLLGAMAAIATIPETQFNAQLVLGAYTPEVLGQITGMVLLSVIWYRYFCVSKRVKGYWG